MLRVRLRYLTLKLRALCWVLRRLRVGRLSRRKTSRAVIARTIIDGSTSDMMESSGVFRWQAGEPATSWACAELVASRPVASRSRGIKVDIAKLEALNTAFVKTSITSRLGI
jgi:hypothetical protein